MKQYIYIFLLFIGTPAHAALNVFACEPEWAALVQELAGDKADIYSATTALQDPHMVQARPSLISRAHRAQLVICTGAGLESGWLPLVMRESSNPAIAPGQNGNFEAADYVAMLERPAVLSRSEGDVHPEGNPHIQLDARNFLPIAQALTQRLALLDPANSDYYRARLRDFTLRWQAALDRWEKLAAPLKGQSIIVHHRAFSYLNRWLGLNEVAELEPKPGMEPSVSHMSGVLESLRQHPARMVIRASYQQPQPSEWMAQHAHIAAVVLPFSVGGSDRAKDLFGLFDDILAQLLAGMK